MTGFDSIAARIDRLLTHIDEVARQSGRPAGSVRLLPVSKTFGADAIRVAMQAGMTRFGENKAQDIRDKSAQLADADVQWVMIGHLQTNKARDIARHAHEIQSLDRPELAHALQRRLEVEDRHLTALVQVKTSPEETKFGLDPAALEDFLHFVASETPRLQVQGLMTMAINEADDEAVRDCFHRLRLLRDTLRERAIPGIALDRLSMGMSGDYELAIAEGATEVRLGSAIFGDRSYTS